MTWYKSILLLLVGGIFGAVLANSWRMPGVHAQEQFSQIGGCTSVVPRSWGEFKGASTYGLAFEDEQGNVRFLEHPTCGTLGAPGSGPTSTIDLMVRRR